MTRREKKEIFTTIVKEATQMTSAIEKDRKSEYEEYLYVYFSKFYPVKEEERIGKIEIREGIIESKILIEIRHNNGQVYMTEVPYQKTIAQLEEIKEKSLELLFATIKKIQRYSDIIIEKCKDEKNQQSKNLKKMVEILQRLSGVSGTIRTTYQHSRAILSSEERQEIINSIAEIKKLAQENKIALPPEEKIYQIPKMTQLINSLLEEPSIEDYQYFKLAISYLQDIAKKENKKKSYPIFKKLPIANKLQIAYHEYIRNRLLDCKCELIMKKKEGKNLQKLKILTQQQKRQKMQSIEKKIETNEQITFSEMVTYLHSLDENKKENITVLQNNVKKVLIKLKRLQELFPEENEKITSYINRYETWGKIVETIKLQGTSQGIMEVIEYADHILNKQKDRARRYLETKEEVSNKDKLELYSEMEMLEIFVSYLLDDVRQTEEQSALEEVIENHILEKKNQINSFFRILNISGRLSFLIMSQNQQDVFQMEEMIENYFQAQEVLVIESFHPIYSKVQEYVKVQCQEIESWDPQMMQIVREDYLDIPKEKLLKKV